MRGILPTGRPAGRPPLRYGEGQGFFFGVVPQDRQFDIREEIFGWKIRVFPPQKAHEHDAPRDHQADRKGPFETESGVVLQRLDPQSRLEDPVPVFDAPPQTVPAHALPGIGGSRDLAGRQQEPFERVAAILGLPRFLHVNDGQSDGGLGLVGRRRKDLDRPGAQNALGDPSFPLLAGLLLRLLRSRALAGYRDPKFSDRRRGSGRFEEVGLLAVPVDQNRGPVVLGPHQKVDRLLPTLRIEQLEEVRLPIHHADHTSLADPIIDRIVHVSMNPEVGLNFLDQVFQM